MMSSREISGDSFAASAAQTTPDVEIGDVLNSSSTSYLVLDFIGEGSFGKITASLNLWTNKEVAIKILKQETKSEEAKHEVDMLNVISVLDVDRTNIVRFHEQFQHMEKTCFVFEMLDLSLFDLMEQRDKPLPLQVIRPVAKQLLVALDALKRLGVLHTDIKPDNVMIISMQDQPIRVKLIDFGCALRASKVQVGMYIQAYGYRAPEISLGLPFSEAVDVWAVGCTLAFIYLTEHLFDIDCEYQMMKSIVTLLGQPQDKLLRAGMYSRRLFIEEEGEGASSWRLRTTEEFTAATNVKTENGSFVDLPSSLSDLIHPEAAEMEDHKEFVSFLGELLNLDGDERISPRQALQRPFIVSDLREDADSEDNQTTSQTEMRVCPTEDSLHCLTTDSGYDKVSGDSVENPHCTVPPCLPLQPMTPVTSPASLSTDSTWSLLCIDEVSPWCTEEAVDVPAAATASSGGFKKLLKSTWKFYSNLVSCCRPQVED